MSTRIESAFFPALNGRPHGHDEVGIDFEPRFEPESLVQQPMHQWRAGGAPDQHDLVDVLRVKLGVVKRLVNAIERFLEQAGDHRLVLDPLQLELQVVNRGKRGSKQRRFHKRREGPYSLCSYGPGRRCRALVVRVAPFY